MKYTIVSLLIFGSMIGGALLASSIPQSVSAESAFENATGKLKTSSEKAGLGDPDSTNPSSVVNNMINIVIGILGVVAVILVVYAGGLWLTAAGSEDKVTKAKKIIRSTVVGVVIVALAYAITTFIIGIATGG